MSSKTTRVISDEVLGVHKADPRKTDHLITSVFYQLGGMSYFSYKQEPRGYYLSARLEGHGDGLISTELFTGGRKVLLEEANRFSTKRLATLAQDAQGDGFYATAAAQLQEVMRAQWEEKNA